MSAGALGTARLVSNHTASSSTSLNHPNIQEYGRNHRQFSYFYKQARGRSRSEDVCGAAASASPRAIDLEVAGELVPPSVAMKGHSPNRKTCGRSDLHAKVGNLKGRPFTAAFLAAATDTDISEVDSRLCLRIPSHWRVYSLELCLSSVAL